ncbi:MAG TPA: hypothetical protein VFM18_16145 [Methanosarcina sp.]|nr:hypothetical protein [Methanosarcina sp.]
MKEHNHESIRLMANDQLLKSKGFLLFCVDDFGVLTMCGDSSDLNPAEQWGLENYAHHNTITHKINIEDE